MALTPYAEDTNLLFSTGDHFDSQQLDYFKNALAGDVQDLLKVKPTTFVRFGIYVRVVEEGRPPRMEKFSFAERRYLRRVYDTPSKRVLLKCGRQVEKSTSLGNIILAYSCILSGFQTLFVSPSRDQTFTFSRDRLKEPTETSAELRAWLDQRLADSVALKKFMNRSQITLRYAFHNADRVRGIPADMIMLDEIQDIYLDHIPVILECASHSPYKIYRFSGTPKSLDNAIEYYWTERSTQNEWVVPCHRHGIPSTKSRGLYWNVLGEKNIGKKGLICESCGQSIDPRNPESMWASTGQPRAAEEPYEGFRIPQLMVPWIPWNEILDKYEDYSRPRFYNEVLGMSYDSGTRPLVRADIIQNCDDEIRMFDEEWMKNFKRVLGTVPVYAGVDWGTGENSYTVLSLGTYIGGFFTIFYVHRFTGVESEPQEQLALIKGLVRSWGIRLIGVDYGGGFYQNDELIRAFGQVRVHKYQYLAPNKKVSWDDRLRRWLVHRSEVMSDVFNAIKRGNVFRFPRWEDFEDPYAKDMLNIFSEYNEHRRLNEYKRSPGATDDAFHSILYCFLVSMIDRPRPDVIAPQRSSS